jgi:hypothetical protein
MKSPDTGTAPDGPDPDELSAEANRLRNRFTGSGNRADLDEAERLGREALRRAARGSVSAGVAAFNQGITLSLLFEQTGRMQYADEALALLEQAERLLPQDHPDASGVYAGQAGALARRFQQSYRVGDLDASITAARRGIGLSAPDDPRLAGWHSNLGGALRLRFMLTDAPADIDAAIEQGRQAVALSDAGARQPAVLRAALGASLSLRFAHTGSPADLAETIDVAREALRLAEGDQHGRQMAVGVLAAALRADFERTGDFDRLSEAIACLRTAVDGLRDGHGDLAANLANLCSALVNRYERFHTRDDLDQAVIVAQRALAQGQAALEAVIRGVLVKAYNQRAQLALHEDDAQAAVEACDLALAEIHRAVDLLPAGHRDRNALLTSRGNALQIRFQAAADASDGRAAVAAYREAADSTAEGDPQRALLLGNLGMCQLSRALADPASQDVDEAIATLRQAVRIGDLRNPAGAQATANLAAALFEKARSGTNADTGQGRADYAEILALFTELSTTRSAPSRLRLSAAALAAQIWVLDGNLARSADMYTAAVELLPRTAWHGLNQAVKEQALIDHTGLGSDAAAIQIAGGMAGRALELIEQGRNVLWAQRLQHRATDARLEAAYPGHARRLRDLAQALDVVE